MQRTPIRKILAILTLTFSTMKAFDASAKGASCERPRGNPYECTFQIREGGNDVWLGVNDPASVHNIRTSPLYVGRQWGGPVGCNRFSQYFYNHRAKLSQISCGVGFYGVNPESPSAYVYVQIGDKPFRYPPSGPYKMNYLEIGSADYNSIHDRARRELENCNRVLEFVKFYESTCPR